MAGTPQPTNSFDTRLTVAQRLENLVGDAGDDAVAHIITTFVADNLPYQADAFYIPLAEKLAVGLSRTDGLEKLGQRSVALMREMLPNVIAKSRYTRNGQATPARAAAKGEVDLERLFRVALQLRAYLQDSKHRQNGLLSLLESDELKDVNTSALYALLALGAAKRLDDYATGDSHLGQERTAPGAQGVTSLAEIIPILEAQINYFKGKAGDYFAKPADKAAA